MCAYTITFEVYTVLVYFAFLNPDVVCSLIVGGVGGGSWWCSWCVCAQRQTDSCNFLAPAGSLATDNAGFYFSKSQTTAGTCDIRPKLKYFIFMINDNNM